jgi:ketosteroid isomerase-like protein
MSRDNVDIVRAGYDAIARGDLDALFELLDPEIEMGDSGNFPDVDAYWGHQGVLDFFAKQASVFEDFRLVPERFIPVGNEVIVLHKQVGTSRLTGMRLEANYAHVWTMQDGRAIRGRTYDSWEAALSELGVQE